MVEMGNKCPIGYVCLKRWLDDAFIVMIPY